ncbi:MAG: NfeD family protein [Turicibacter sp.]|nr:NfeD family protein [Turicibacter sp.]
MFGFALSPILIWFILAVAFVFIEAATVGITSIWFAIGSLAAMLSAVLTDSIWIQVLVFMAVSAYLLLKTRQAVAEKLKIGTEKTNLALLVGEVAVVTAPIRLHEPGEVKIDGKIWRAKSESGTPYEVGEVVTVLRISGVTIIVK